jgi:DNA-binding response OmpR family regulator
VTSTDLSRLNVLIMDANSTFASIMREQLYSAGLSAVAWARDIMTARQMLELTDYSALVVSLDTEQGAGQYLVDEMRQARVLKPSIVVLYITERATYARVMEAAETSADGCIVRPYRAEVVIGKLAKAARRNNRLKDLYAALQRDDADEVLRLAGEHIQKTPDLQNFCSRLAVELLLQRERPQEALDILQALPDAHSLAWVQLASARAELLANRRNAAQKRLAGMIERDPGYADAHDLLGRLQVEQGDLKAARQSLEAACSATPGCMIRTQHAGALAYFCGDAGAARILLNRARMIGGDSRLLDGLTLFLLGVLEADAGALASMRQVRDQLGDMAQRHRISSRLQRMRRALDALYLFRSTGEVSQALVLLEKLAQEMQEADFRGEDCAVVAVAWSRLRVVPGRVAGDLSGWLSRAGMRLITGRGMLGYLSAAVASVPDAVAALESCHVRVMQHAQAAVDACADPQRGTRIQEGVRTLYAEAQSLRNARLLDLCVTLSLQHRGRLGPEATSIIDVAGAMSERYSPGLRSITGIARGKKIAGAIVPARLARTAKAEQVDVKGERSRTRPGAQLVTSTGPGGPPSGFVDLWFEAR